MIAYALSSSSVKGFDAKLDESTCHLHPSGPLSRAEISQPLQLVTLMAHNQHPAAKQESTPTQSSTTKALLAGPLGAVLVPDRVAGVPSQHKHLKTSMRPSFIPC